MSYEGFEQILCANGHYSVQDAIDYVYCDNKLWRCKVCDAHMAWHNSVDTTNGVTEINPETLLEERIDGYVELEVDKDLEVHTCGCCGHQSYKGTVTYKIPEGDGRCL